MHASGEDTNHNIIITIIICIRAAWRSLERSFKHAMAEISWGNGLRLTLIYKDLINYIWSLKYTSTLEIQHFLAVFISIAYNRYGTCKVRKEITRNKNELTKKVSLHFQLIKHGQYCAWFHWVRVRTAQLGPPTGQGRGDTSSHLLTRALVLRCLALSPEE